MAFDRTDTQSAQVVPSPRTTPRVIDTWTGFGCLQAPPDRHPGPDLAVCKPTAAEFAHPTQPPPLVPPILSPTGSSPASQDQNGVIKVGQTRFADSHQIALR